MAQHEHGSQRIAGAVMCVGGGSRELVRSGTGFGEKPTVETVRAWTTTCTKDAVAGKRPFAPARIRGDRHRSSTLPAVVERRAEEAEKSVGGGSREGLRHGTRHVHPPRHR
ncbi:hypothetical protein E2562_027023 [Oryza meyeriana var. granulata]|uniref:Uncharacterized protein n=1 Tax=Oryza meyeriana var. granulata TaxID=110450 RepID=A0A6G1C872_9ORYZ|nr:hypothetical protein E2562_027023 [Oryza meyeriana var. granulata]